MLKTATIERTLSQKEAQVILDLEWRKRKTLTLAELRQMMGASQTYANFMAHRLVQKGWLERIRPGLYQLIPAERGREGVPDTHPLAAGALLVSPYFFSFGTACTHHGLTEQVFADVYVACQERRPPELIRGKRYVFVYVSKARFMGSEEVSVLGQAVQMATLERALLDALDRPRYAGGIGEVSHIIARARDRITWKDLYDLASGWESSALVQRLGYFLDLNQIPMSKTLRKKFLSLVRPKSKIHLGARKKWGTSGPLIAPWNVIENVPRNVLMSKDTASRHRVVFERKGKGA